MSQYFRVQLEVDESFLDKAFKQIEVRLDRLEERILELQQLLRGKADRTDVTDLGENVHRDLEGKLNQLNSRLLALESKADSRIKEIESEFASRVKELLNSFDGSLNQKLSVLETRISERDPKIDNLTERLEASESALSATEKELHLARESVQAVATAFAMLNHAEAVLDDTLGPIVTEAANHVNDNFSRLFEEFERIRDRQRIAAIVASTSDDGGESRDGEGPALGGGSSQTLNQEGPRSTSPQQTSLPGSPCAALPRVILPPIQTAVRTGTADHRPVAKKGTVRENVVVEQSVNFAELRPYPPSIVHWTDPPVLPGIRQFNDMAAVVDYIYRLIPKLQAHLSAIHVKVVDLDQLLESKADRSLMEKMFDRFQAVTGELKSGMDDLKEGLEETATRDEINGIVDEIFNQMNVESQTSIGRVKCIACGRDIHKVAGALTEGEIARALGTPPNSMAFHSSVSPPIGMQFTSREGFNSAITESPRAVRPFKPMHVRPKLKGSAHPSG
jgi:predicted  nucleic acid-binding Zn-ribbon protein